MPILKTAMQSYNFYAKKPQKTYVLLWLGLRFLGVIGMIGVIGRLENLGNLGSLEIKNYSLLTTNYFSSEVVRCGASQKNSPRDSTKSYSPRTITFRDAPQIAAYHEKLLFGS